MGEGPYPVTDPNQTPNAGYSFARSQTAGAKIRSQEGNSPDRRLRPPSCAKWKRMWGCPDNQDVGLEAATI